MGNTSNRLVSIIVVTAGGPSYLKSCLDSIEQQTYSTFEVIVIDNSLEAFFSQETKECYPNIKLYSSQKNLFYCAALNKGIAQTTGDFILCLNDDVLLDRGFIEEALKGFSIDERIGMVSGKILRSDAKTIDSTGLFLSLYRTAKERGYGLKDKKQFQKQGFIFGVNGAAAFYRKEMLEDIKENDDYFDSDFHFFYEDLDIAWRAKKKGWKAYYVPSAIAYHVRGGTARLKCGVNKPFARRYISDELHLDLIKNRYLAIIKNESCLDFLLHFPFALLYDLIVWSYILVFRPQLIKIFFQNAKYLKNSFQRRVIKSSKNKINL